MTHVDEVLKVLLTSSKGNPSTQHFLRQVPLYSFSTLLNRSQCFGWQSWAVCSLTARPSPAEKKKMEERN